jgi:hypothetical protein
METPPPADHGQQLSDKLKANPATMAKQKTLQDRLTR